MEVLKKLANRLVRTILLALLLWLLAAALVGNNSHYAARTLLLCCCIAATLTTTYDWVVFPFFVDYLRKLPTVTIGDVREVLPITTALRGKRPLEWLKKFPGADLINVRIVTVGSVLLAVSPQAHRDVLSTHAADFEKPEFSRDYLGGIIGHGLILSEGANHKRQRRLLDPSFKIQNIRTLHPLIAEKTELMLEKVQEEVRVQGWIEIASWGSRLTMDIIGPALMSTDFQSLTTEGHPLEKAYAALVSPSPGQTFLFGLSLLLPQWIVRRLPLATNTMLATNTGIVRQTCHEILQKKLETFKSDAFRLHPEIATADILGSIMSRGELQADELVDQMMTFLAAGHETTASSIAWVTHLLTLPQYEHYQALLRDEVQAAIAVASTIAGHFPSPSQVSTTSPPPTTANTNCKTPLSFESLESLPLLNGICEETLRLFPPVTNTGRKAIHNTYIAGVPVKQNTMIVLFPWAINRNPHFWGADADQLVPERWIDELPDGSRRANHHGRAPSNMCLQTFLHGHRACIGRDLAKAELRVFVAAMFGWFRVRRLEGDDGSVLPAGALTIKPQGGLKVSLQAYEELVKTNPAP